MTVFQTQPVSKITITREALASYCWFRKKSKYDMM